MASVTVVIPARNAAATIGPLLDDLKAGPIEQAEVVLVDDGSTDGTADVAATHAAGIPHFSLVTGPGRGPAAARNVGARHATSDWLAFTDADVRLPPEWLSAGLAAASSGCDVVEGIVEPRGGDTHGLVRHRARSVGGEAFVTANLWVARAVFTEVGGFDESYTAPWREDTDLGWRLLSAGARSKTDPDLVVFHPHYRRPLRSLFREGVRIEADTRLRKKFPQRARALQPRRLFRRSYIATHLLLAALAVLLMGEGVWAIALIAAAELTALTAAIRTVGERGSTRPTEWLGLAALALPLATARTYWTIKSNLRMRAWFW